MRHEKFYKICANRPQFQNKKIFEIFFMILNTMESSTIMKVVHSEYERGHQNK
jgi:hypothetical protein